jgi:hypothetical protein
MTNYLEKLMLFFRHMDMIFGVWDAAKGEQIVSR